MAIIIDRTITIKDDKATLDRPLYLYIGDGDITCLFTIEEKKKAATFGAINKTNTITENASYGEVRIYKPDKGSDGTSRLVFTDRAEIIDDKLQVIFSYKNIDDFSEAGIHKLQIHLYDDDDSARNRFTIPPIDINVLLPVGYDNNAIDEAIVGYSLLDTRGIEEPTFDEEGNYNKTEWQTGDIITKNKLNKIEDALYEINAADSNFITNEALEAELDNIDAALNGKANMGHTHKEYATKTELNGKAPAKHYHSEYAYSNHGHNEYAYDDHIHENYATLSTLSNYATKNYVNNSGFLTAIPKEYVTEGELENILATKTYASIAYVDMAIKNNGGTGGGTLDPDNPDLSDYVTKPYLDIMLDTKSNITHNHDGDYISNNELSNYATKAFVNEAVDNIKMDDIELTDYYTKEETNNAIDNALSNKADNGHTHPEFDNFAVIDHTHDYADSNHTHDEYVTGTAMNEAIGNINKDLDNYAKKKDIPTVPTKLSEFTDDVGYAKEATVNQSINNINNNITNNYAKKEDVPTNVSTLNNDAGYITEENIPTNVSEFTNDAKYVTEDNMNSTLSNYAETSDMPTSTNDLYNNSGFITSGKDNSGNYYITRIEVVDELPVPEERGVLYIVRANKA